MSYETSFRPRADRDLRALPRDLQKRVAAALTALAEDPRSPDTKALQGQLRGLRRARVGDYRIVYFIRKQVVQVEIVRVAHRREVYRH